MIKNGFTLVELLAVIIILSLLALLASTAIVKLLGESKNDLYETQILAIEEAAKIWAADNLNKLPDIEECKYLTLEDLKEAGTLDSNVIDARTLEELSDDMIIKITGIKGQRGNLILNYEVDANSVADCQYVY